MRRALGGLGRNLAAGLRLALFVRVERNAFRISAAQFVLLVIVSAAIDIDADWLRAPSDARFSLLGLQGELFALGLLVLTSALIAMLRRERDVYPALPIVILASFPAIQVVHLLPTLPGAAGQVSQLARDVFDDAVLAWMFVVAMRGVYVCIEPHRRHRRAFAVFAGALLIAPLWLAPLAGPLEPWWREFDAAQVSGEGMNPASEPVLAAQQLMLDRALDDLEDERPGVADLYFVGFAPDARHPGFVTDVDAAKRAMDERWKTRGRSIALVNSPLTIAERPFATITNLREVLLEIGDMIDADDDVVMVYLTGTSRPDHALNAVNRPLELVGLSPRGLKELLDAAGIRWRIVVVSTCNAGAWVDALKDDETLVIASSAAGARGRDCDGGISASAFGQAFFTQAMRRNDDIEAAFDASRRDLARLHAPEPVMAMGASIAEHLKRLRDQSGARVVARVTTLGRR